MTAMPLEDHSLYEREQLARIDATPAAPESFDPIAALRRVEAVAEELGAEAADLSLKPQWGDALRYADDRIRGALAPQADR